MYNVKKISGHSSASVKVLENDDEIVLRSYSTDVCIYNKNTGIMNCTGLYSATTIKHIGWFMREYFPEHSYYSVKDAVQKNNGILKIK